MKKLTVVVVVLFMLISCGVAQNDGSVIFASIKTDSLFDANNNLTPAGNLLVERIAVKMDSDPTRCLNVSLNCISGNDTICYQKTRALIDSISRILRLDHIFFDLPNSTPMSCEDCLEFYLIECPETSSGNDLPIFINYADTDTLYTPTVINKTEYKDTLGIKILKTLSENRKMARICKESTWILNNPYNIVYFIDTTKIPGITGNLFESDFCIITHDKDLSKNNRYKTLFVTYFKHGNFSGDVSLITGDGKKITTVDCELIAESSGNWKVHHIKIKKRNIYKIKR